MPTAAIKLIPHAPEHLLAMLEGSEHYAELFGVPLAEALRAFLVSDDVQPEYLERLRSAVGADFWMHGFAVVHARDNLLIGMAGFKGPPDDAGMVEIAYGIAPGYQGQGLATAAARLLMDFASADPRVRLLRAHTFSETNASTGVLTKCGFAKVGEVIDPEDGLVWHWERGVGG